MESAEFAKRMVNVVVQVQLVDIAISSYSEQDVEPFDVANGEHLRELQRIRNKYDRAQVAIRRVLTELRNNEVKKKQDLTEMQTGLLKRTEDNEERVRRRAMVLARTAA